MKSASARSGESASAAPSVATGRGAAIDGSPHGAPRIRMAEGCVGACAQRNAGLQESGAAIEPRPLALLHVDAIGIAALVHEVGLRHHGDWQCRQQRNQLGRRHSSVLDAIPGHRADFRQGAGRQHQFDTRHAVDGYGAPRGVSGDDVLAQLVERRQVGLGQPDLDGAALDPALPHRSRRGGRQVECAHQHDTLGEVAAQRCLAHGIHRLGPVVGSRIGDSGDAVASELASHGAEIRP